MTSNTTGEESKVRRVLRMPETSLKQLIQWESIPIYCIPEANSVITLVSSYAFVLIIS